MWYRPVDPEGSNSSEEMLLNPRPHRSQHGHRQHHPKHNSQTTLRGRGAKRQKSRKDVRHDNSGGKQHQDLEAITDTHQALGRRLVVFRTISPQKRKEAE